MFCNQQSNSAKLVSPAVSGTGRWMLLSVPIRHGMAAHANRFGIAGSVSSLHAEMSPDTSPKEARIKCTGGLGNLDHESRDKEHRSLPEMSVHNYTECYMHVFACCNMEERLMSNSLASCVHDKAFLGTRLPRPCSQKRTLLASSLISCVASSSGGRRRKTQVTATQSVNSPVTLDRFLLRGGTLLINSDPSGFGVAVESLERSLQATPSFPSSSPPTKREHLAVEAPAVSPRPRSGKTGSRSAKTSTAAAALFDAPLTGRLTTIKSTRSKPGKELQEGGRRRQRTAKASSTAGAPLAADSPVTAAVQQRRGRGRPAKAASTTAATMDRPKQKHSTNKQGSSHQTQMQQDVQAVRTLRKRLQQARGAAQAGRQAVPSSTMTMFLRNIANTPVLNKREEFSLARLVQQGVHVSDTRSALREELGCSPSDEQVCKRLQLPLNTNLGRVEALGEAAEDLMVQYNLRLVVSVCKRYLNRGVEITDLISEGMQGLSRAVKRFKPCKGFKFSTYAHWWIRQAVVRALNEYSRVVRLPVHVCDIVNKIRRVEAELVAKPNRLGPPTHAEIGAVLGLPAFKVSQYITAARPTKSLEAPAYEAGGYKADSADMEFGETLAQPESQEDEEQQRSMLRLLQDDINALLGTLPPRERNVIRMRYGLHTKDGDVKTFKDIGTAYGLTQERIRQIEDKALTKLRRPWRQKLLRPHLYSLQGVESEE